MSAIVFDSVSKRYKIHHEKSQSFQETIINLLHRRNGTTEEFWALKDVDFEVDHGETVGIIGPNGSGKSTALKLITKVIGPTKGKVTTKGRLTSMIELGAGFHPDLTGRENIFLLGSILGYGARAMRQRFDGIVEFAELERFIDTPLKHYSSGMSMRLGFSIIINLDPEVLLIDEVLAVGDLSFQEKCLGVLRQFQVDGVTIVMVSHDLELVGSYCNRAVLLQHGEVAAQGHPQDVISAYVAAQPV